jgi:hypothetical protein
MADEDHFEDARRMLERLEPSRLRIRSPHLEASVAMTHALLAMTEEVRALRRELSRRQDEPPPG